MINYILFGVLIFFSFINLLISVGISNFLIKFYDLFLEYKINIQNNYQKNNDQKNNDQKNNDQKKGLVDINLVGTYDERFKK